MPAPFRKKASGVLVNFEVDDVDTLYAKAQEEGLKIHLACATSLSVSGTSSLRIPTASPST